MSYIFADEATSGAIRDQYELGKELGSGTFSTVRVAKHKATGRDVAVKIIDKANVDTSKEALRTEVQILMRVEHPNIVKLFEIYESPRKVYLVMELLQGGELFDRIVNVYPNGYSERDASIIIYKLVSAIDYLHTRGIVHRDLKPENLLYVSDSPAADIKITDFGLAKIMRDDDMLKTACGTPSYVAPEVLLNQGYGEAVDLWSIGVVMYVILCGYPPFFSESTPELFDQICEGSFQFQSPYWDNVSTSAKDLISRLLQVDPTKRFTTKQVLNHPWIKGITATAASMPAVFGELNKYNARRRFKLGVETVMATIRMKKAAAEAKAKH
jgi:calcium/calmodulin-dependent protein kinase I